MFKHISDYAVATAGASSGWWFVNLNDGILVPIATLAGIVYIGFKTYFLIKNQGKE